jgi:peptidoglycan/xylan/chitin deacetylase (PgdA/CDA1 family)
MKNKSKHILARIWGAKNFFLKGLRSSKSELFVPILCYHSVNNLPDDHVDPLSIDLLKEHMAFIRDNYTAISLRKFVACLDGHEPCPKNAVVITFDDGYVDNYDNALPILKKYSIPATFFLVTGFIDGSVDLIGRPEWRGMTWPQVREISRHDLFDIGGHTHSHALLASLSTEKAIAEVLRSREILEKNLEMPVDLFAYPNGQGKDISPEIKDYIAQAGFLCSCSTFWRCRHKKREKYIINRIMIGGKDSVQNLALKMKGHYDYIYYIHKTKALLNVLFGRKTIWR